MTFGFRLLALCGVVLLGAACRPAAPGGGGGPVRLNFSHFKLPDPAPLEAIISDFERTHPGVDVRETVLPNSTDAQHQRYAIELGARDPSIDVLAADVIWVAEFARAGWLQPLDPALQRSVGPTLLAASREACTFKDRLYAIPWIVGAGLLYYREDLLDKYGFAPPDTVGDLAKQARTILEGEKRPGLVGFVWQGKQYEGLVCDFLEYLWGAGGDVLAPDGSVAVDAPATRRALAVMHGLVHRERVTPDYVTTFDEEASRRVFQNGDAVFMRNWPYAWALLESAESPVRGKVAQAVMPGIEKGRASATLGGWNLGVSRYSPNSARAWQFVRYMTSPTVQKRFTLAYGEAPTLDALYADPDILAAFPAFQALHEVFLHAHPRPVSPYYPQISAVLQTEVSAVLAEVRDPEHAAREMGRQMRFLVLEQ